MEINIVSILITVSSLVILALPGIILSKLKMLPKNAGAVLSTLVLYVCQPMLVFMGFQGKTYRAEIGINILIVAGITLVVHTVMFALVAFIVRNKDQKIKIGCMRFASCFGNCGYMGIPFLKMLFTGSVQGEIIIYAAVVIAIFNLLNWTVGVFMITGDKKKISFKKVILNPTVIAVIVGFLVFFFAKVPIVDLAPTGTTLDEILTALIGAVNFLSEMVTPLAMIVIGIRLAGANLKKLFLDKSSYYVCFLKLIVMSIVSTLVVAFLPISAYAKYAIFFTLSMPSATSTVLFSEQFGGDSESGSVYVLTSTILSIVTIPIMFMIFSAIATI